MAKRGTKATGAAKKPVESEVRKTTRPPTRPPKKSPQKLRKVKGTVLKIVNGRPTDQRLEAEEAFGDPEQAVEQVLYAQRHASREELRLVRLAFRQYQGKRFRSK